MALEVDQRNDQVSLPSRAHRRRGVVLVAVAVFQAWLWGTRVWNLVRDASSFSSAFVGVHLGLYVAAIAVGAVLAVMGVRMIREARRHGHV